MLQLEASEWYEVRNRGKCAYITQLPEAFYKYYWNPKQLVNQHVEIDGQIYTVTGAEVFMIGCSKDNPYKLPCGLCVRPFSDTADPTVLTRRTA
jgi:hypothetical protein